MILIDFKKGGCRMRRIVSFLLACLLLGALLVSAVSAAVLPENEGLATARTAIEAAVGKDAAGAAVLVIEGGEPLMSEGFGYADIAAGALVTRDTVFELGELSALFVTLSVLRLADEGVLSLDDTLTDHLDEDVAEALRLKYPVTVRQLLAGQGGFGGRVMDISYEKEKYTFDNLTEAVLAAVPEQVTAPGTVTAYSHFGIALLALVVEGKTGQPFGSYVTDCFLEPLGMKDTQCAFRFSPEAPATGYTLGEDGLFYTDAGNGRRYAALYPATGAVTSLADMQRLLSFMLSENGLSAASRALLAGRAPSGMMTMGATPLIPLQNGALLLTGKTACFGAALVIDFNKASAALVLANTPTTTLLSLPTALFGGEPLPLTLPEGQMVELKPLGGTYLPTTADLTSFVGRLAAVDAGVTVRVKEDTLYLGDTALVQIARGVFADAGEPEKPLVQFILNENGGVAAMLTAEGISYTAASLFRTGLLARVAFGALLVLGVGLLAFALLGFLRWLSDVDRKGKRDSVLPPLAGGLAALTALLAGAQVLLAFRRGAAAISSAYFALRILVLLSGIVAMIALVLAFFTSVFSRRVHRHMALTGITFVLFFLLSIFFGLTVM